MLDRNDEELGNYPNDEQELAEETERKTYEAQDTDKRPPFAPFPPVDL